MNKKPQILMDHYLKQLRLPTILREYRKVAEQCAREDLDCQRFLLRLVELEVVEQRPDPHVPYRVLGPWQEARDEIRRPSKPPS